MNFNQKSLKRSEATLCILAGILLSIISLKFIFTFFALIVLLINLPNFIASLRIIGNNQNKFVIAIFTKSLILIIMSMCIILFPEHATSIIIGAGLILIIGTYYEYKTSLEPDKTLKKHRWLFVLAIILIIIGSSSIFKILEIIKYVIGGCFIIYGIVILCTVKKDKVNFEEILREYEKRYQETYGKEDNENGNTIIDSTVDEDRTEENDD